MKDKGISLVLILNLVAMLTIAQPTDHEVKQAISTAIDIRNAESAEHGEFKIPGDYLMNSGKVVGMKYFTNNFLLNYKGGNTGLAFVEITGDKVMRVIFEDPGCYREYVDIENGDIIERNADGRLVRVEEKSYTRYDKYSSKRKYLLEYSNNRLSKVTCFEVFARPQSGISERLKLLTVYNWSGDDKVVADVEFVSGYTKKGKPLSRKKSIIYTCTPNSLSIEDPSDPVDRIEYVRNETEIRHNRLSRYGTYLEIATIQNNRISQTERWENNPDKSFKSHVLVQHIYELKRSDLSKDDICNYDVTYSTIKYDQSGIGIEEQSGQNFRLRNADGTWGPWQSRRM